MRDTSKLAGIPVATLLLALSVAAPVVQRADLAHQTVVESEHDPARCPTPHDHSICAQMGASQAAASSGPPKPMAPTRVDVLCRSGRTSPASALFTCSGPARAPPSI